MFCADFNRHLQICPEAELGLAEQLLLGVVDTALMAQNAFTAAESLGLGGVYIGGLRNNIESVTELLKLPKHVLPLFGLCLGWPADNPDLKPRIPAAMLVHENHYQPVDRDVLHQYDEELANYYLTRDSNNRRDTGATIFVAPSSRRTARSFSTTCTNRAGQRGSPFLLRLVYDRQAFTMSLERCRVKIAILSRDGTLYSCKRLREAAAKRGHQVEILDPMSCYMNIDPAASSIHYKGRKLPHFDAVIPRIGSQITYYGTAALRQFEMLGSYPLNESVAISRARDKLRSLQLLARGDRSARHRDCPLPDDTSDLIDMVGGAPLVIKLVEGTQGIGVVLAETRQAAESVIDAFRGLNAHILVQEYIKEAKGCDIRCFVVGNEVVAAIERQAKEGDFRSNLHRGGIARVALISEREREIAVKAAQTLGPTWRGSICCVPTAGRW